MNWWRELNEDGPDGYSMLDLIAPLLALFLAETGIPLVVIAVGISYVVQVEPWIPILAVLSGWPIQWRLWPSAIGTFAVNIGAAAINVIGALAWVISLTTLQIAIWGIGRLEDRDSATKAAADNAVYPRAADVRRERDAFLESRRGHRWPPRPGGGS